MGKEESWRGDVTMMQIKGRRGKRAEREHKMNAYRRRDRQECGMSGADKSRHALRWEDHHGDGLN